MVERPLEPTRLAPLVERPQEPIRSPTRRPRRRLTATLTAARATWRRLLKCFTAPVVARRPELTARAVVAPAADKMEVLLRLTSTPRSSRRVSAYAYIPAHLVVVVPPRPCSVLGQRSCRVPERLLSPKGTRRPCRAPVQDSHENVIFEVGLQRWLLPRWSRAIQRPQSMRRTLTTT